MSSNSLEVVVYGARGAQGQAIAQVLLKGGHKVRVVVRSEEGADALTSAGATLFIGDMDSEESLVQASQGADAAVIILPVDYDRDRVLGYMRHIVAAAKKGGVKLIVFSTSSQTVSETTGIPLLDIKRDVQEYLAGETIPCIVLRPTVYLGNLLGPWTVPAIVNEGVLAYPVADNVKVSWISWEDQAKFVLAALGKPELAGSTIDIGGTQAVTGPELANIIGAVIGRTVQYQMIPFDAFGEGLNQAIGAPAGTEIARFYQWFSEVGTDNLAVDADKALQLLPIELTSIDSWAAQQPWQALAEQFSQ